jgi:hypothetical protein
MQASLKSANSFAVGMYLFFAALLLQNLVVLSFLATGVAFSVSVIYGIKYVLMLLLVCLLFLSRNLYRVLVADKVLLAVIGVVLVMSLVRGGGSGYVAEELRFYLGPVAFYLIGKTAAPFMNERQVGYFVVFVGCLYVAIGFLFVLIDRNLLLEFGLKEFFRQKLSDIGRGDETFNGLPNNFYFFREGASVIYRAFGAFFDPLVTAFFGASLLFFLYETYRRKLAKYAGLLTILVGVLMLLTLTRAIILVVAFVLVFSLVHKRGIAALPIWLALVFAGAAVIAVALNFESLLLSLDPSSVAHLSVYSNVGLTTSLIGSPPDPASPRGAESLYLTIFMEFGIGALVVFVVWFTSIYRVLLRKYEQPYVRPALESMFVYLLASFTTEHWFIFTSGALFWSLLGNVMSNAERNEKCNEEQPRSVGA